MMGWPGQSQPSRSGPASPAAVVLRRAGGSALLLPLLTSLLPGGTLHPEIMSRGHVPPGARRLCPPAPRPQALPLLLGLGPGPAWAQGACGSHSSSPTRPPAPWRGWIYEGGSACASLGRIVQGPCGHRVSHSLSCCWWGGGGTALALGWFPIFSCDLLVETRCLSPRPGHPGAHCQSASQML